MTPKNYYFDFSWFSNMSYFETNGFISLIKASIDSFLLVKGKKQQMENFKT